MVEMVELEFLGDGIDTRTLEELEKRITAPLNEVMIARVDAEMQFLIEDE